MTSFLLYALVLTAGLFVAFWALLPLAVINWLVFRAAKLKREIQRSNDIGNPAQLCEFVDGMQSIAFDLSSDDVVPSMGVAVIVMLSLSKMDPHSQRIILEGILWTLLARMCDSPRLLVALVFRKKDKPLSLNIKVTITPETTDQVVTQRINFERTALKTYAGHRLAHF